MTGEAAARWLPALAGAGLVMLVWQGPGPLLAATLIAALGLVALQIAWQDAARLTISDAALVALGLLGLAARLADGIAMAEPASAALGTAALEAGLCGGAFWLLREVFYRRRGYDGLGFGDVKLAACGGLLIGAEGLAWATLAASLSGLGLALVLRLRPAGPVRDEQPLRLPFGALLAPLLWLAWLVASGLPQLRAGPAGLALGLGG